MYIDYLQLENQVAVAEKHGISAPTLSNLFALYGFGKLPRSSQRKDLSRPPGKRGRRRRDCSALVAKMHKDYLKGKTLTEVGEKYGTNISRVSLLFKEHGFKVNQRGRRKGATVETLKNAALAVDLYREGQTLESIGARLGVTRERVRQWMELLATGRKEIRNEHREEKMESLSNEVRELAALGYSVTRIAQTMGTNPPMVKAILKRNNIPISYKQGSKFSMEVIKEWGNLYQSGISTIEISRRYKVGNGNVSRLLRQKLGIKLRDRYNLVPEAMVNKFISLHGQGRTLRYISREFGFSVQTVKRYLVKAGVPPYH